jgi:putative aldouronate transport system substrate-binding protein
MRNAIHPPQRRRGRRTAALPVTLFVLLTLLVACGSGSTATVGTGGGAGGAASPATGGTSTAGAGGIPRFDKPVTVELFTTVNSQETAPPPLDYFWVKAVKDALNIDVKLTFNTESSQYNPKLQARATANDLPDVFTIDPIRTSQLASQGLLADWSPFLKAMPNTVKDRNVEALKPVGTIDGKLYGLTTKSAFPYKTATYVRKDWLDKLGLQVPKTTDEYLAVMKAFTTQDPDGNGKADTYGYSAGINADGSVSNLDPLYGAFGALGSPAGQGWKLQDNQLVPLATSPEMRDALQFIGSMVQSGVMDPDWKAQKPEDFNNKWKAGKIGIFSNDWCATLCPQNYQPFSQANPQGVLQIIDPPVGPTGKSAAGLYSQVGNMYGMSQKAVDAGKGEAVARLLEWIDGPGYELTLFGEEGQGKGYTRDASGKIDVASVNNTQAYIVYRQLAGWGVKGTPEEWAIRYAGTTKQGGGATLDVPKDVLQRAADLPKVETTQFAPLPPAPPEVSADLVRTVNEGAFQFMNGQRPLTEWDNYVKAVNSAGQTDYNKQAAQRAKDIGLIK